MLPRLAIGAAAVLALAGCLADQTAETINRAGADIARQAGLGNFEGVFGRVGTALQLADASEERQLQIATAQRPLIERMYRVSTDRELNRVLNDIARKLSRAGDAGPFPIEVVALQDDAPNALTPGGGVIYVTTGLVRVLPTEAQMAMVIGHEIGHIRAAHVIDAQRAAFATNMGRDQATRALSGGGSFSPAMASVALDTTVRAAFNGYSRAMEAEADRIGLELMMRAGYDAQEAPRTFEALRRASGDQSAVENFLHGSHPRNQQRAEDMRRAIAAARARGGTVDTPAYAAVWRRYAR